MKKLYKILSLSLVAFSLCACTNQATTPKTTDTDPPNGASAGIASGYEQYETVGKVIKFEDKKVHILSGDIVEVFEAQSTDTIKELYIGQTVGFNKITKDVEVFMIEDPKPQYTTMGQQILSVTGKVKKFNDKNVTVTVNDKDILFKLPEKTEFKIGKEITVDYTAKSDDYSDNKYYFTHYVEDSKLLLTVKALKRTDSGVMLLETEDENGVKYDVSLINGCITDFNYSSIKVDSKVTVYPKTIKEIYPNAVDAKKVSLSAE